MVLWIKPWALMQPSGTSFILQFAIKSLCPCAGCAARSPAPALRLWTPHTVRHFHMKPSLTMALLGLCHRSLFYYSSPEHRSLLPIPLQLHGITDCSAIWVHARWAGQLLGTCAACHLRRLLAWACRVPSGISPLLVGVLLCTLDVLNKIQVQNKVQREVAQLVKCCASVRTWLWLQASTRKVGCDCGH